MEEIYVFWKGLPFSVFVKSFETLLKAEPFGPEL